MKVGLLGLGRGGQQLADALLASSWCKLVAVASSRPERLSTFRDRHPDVAGYNDFRSLIVENPLDALFVAMPPYMRAAYLTVAAERKLPVFLLAPPARRLNEATEILQKFEKSACPIAVSRAWGIEAPLQPGSADLQNVGRVFLARGSVMTCWSPDLDWRGDSVRAGGGVLLHSAYGLVDTIVQGMGVPGAVYATMSGTSRPDRRVPYDTEDTAGVTCSFTGGGVAVLSACWTSGPDRWLLEFSGVGGSVEIDERRVLFRDRAGTTTVAAHPRLPNPLLTQVEEFLTAVQTSPRRMRSTLRQHLATMSVMDAIYLSARTGQPEQPSHIAHMHDV